MGILKLYAFCSAEEESFRKTVLKELLAIQIFLNAEKEILLVLFIFGDEVSVLHILPYSLKCLQVPCIKYPIDTVKN